MLVIVFWGRKPLPSRPISALATGFQQLTIELLEKLICRLFMLVWYVYVRTCRLQSHNKSKFSEIVYINYYKFKALFSLFFAKTSLAQTNNVFVCIVNGFDHNNLSFVSMMAISRVQTILKKTNKIVFIMNRLQIKFQVDAMAQCSAAGVPRRNSFFMSVTD